MWGCPVNPASHVLILIKCILANPSLERIHTQAGRHLVWGYLKELRTLPPPPSMCNKYVSSGCVSLPRALYLRGGRLFQVCEGGALGTIWQNCHLYGPYLCVRLESQNGPILDSHMYPHLDWGIFPRHAFHVPYCCVLYCSILSAMCNFCAAVPLYRSTRTHS